ncbi:MAG: hypothetical protein IPJ01_11890 [Micavibrio sp.]|nr:hypothetical protein [Micavibrio sp.]
MIDLTKIKNSKALKWALIIGLPTVLVAGYYGYKYIKNKKEESDNKKNNTDTDTASKETSPIDETKMQYYRIRMPYITDVTNTLSNYLKAKEIPYKFISVKTGMDEKAQSVLDYNVGMLPTDLPKLSDAIFKLGKGIIKPITKEQTVVNPTERAVCLVKRNEIKSFQEFYESVGCLNYSVLFGYDVIGIKNIPNLESKVTLPEIIKLYNRVASEKFNITDEERAELTDILKKIYAE